MLIFLGIGENLKVLAFLVFEILTFFENNLAKAQYEYIYDIYTVAKGNILLTPYYVIKNSFAIKNLYFSGALENKLIKCLAEK